MFQGMKLLPPMRWRFTAAVDIEMYGDRWWPWDEEAISRLPGRDLIALEEATNIPFLSLIGDLRGRGSTLAQMAAMWISMHQAGHLVVWGEFNPLVFATDWEEAPKAPLDSGEDPTPVSSSSPEPETASGTS